MNVLLTAVGRRGYLVHAFRESVAPLGGIVVACNTDPYSTGLAQAEVGLIAPNSSAPEYSRFVLEACERYSIGLALSLHDLDAPWISSMRGDLEALGVVVAVSDRSVLDLCLDKLASSRFLERLDMPSIATIVPESTDAIQDSLLSGMLQFPFWLKPRQGEGSKGMELVRSPREIDFAWDRVGIIASGTPSVGAERTAGDVLAQNNVVGEEYGLDIVNDLSGEFVSCMVRRKLRMRSGETDACMTVDAGPWMDLAATLGQSLGHRGILDVDLIQTDDGERFILDMNPRFGGGYPFSQGAGANLPRAYVAWARGEPPQATDLQCVAGVAFAKESRVIRLAGDGRSSGAEA